MKSVMCKKTFTAFFIVSFICSVVTVHTNTCSGTTGKFAHCNEEYRNFKSVVLAIHGWNGSCESTFGEDDQSIYNILGKDSHYDFDCFDYDSKHTKLIDNIDKLKDRLDLLRQLGYENVMLVTHSTGGVMALALLTDLVLDKEGNVLENEKPIFDDLKIVSIQAWATPINGLRSQISAGGRILSVIGYSPETIPDLAPDSQFLSNLKKRLSKIRDLRNHNDYRWIRSVTNIPIVFLHGEGEDWVVRPILSSDQESSWWWGNLWRVVNTERGHSHNIAESGEVGKPTFPGYTLDTATLLSVPLAPRYDEIFPGDFSEALAPRQLQVVEGMINYGKLQFDVAFLQYQKFLEKIFMQDCARNTEVDMSLVRGLLELVQDQFSPPSKKIAFCFVQSVPYVLEGYDPSGGDNRCKLGRNNPSVALSILQMLEIIYKNVVTYIMDRPWEKDEIFTGRFSSVTEFETKMIDLIARFFESEYDSVHNRALASTREIIPLASQEALLRANIVSKMGGFYSSMIEQFSAGTKIKAEKVFVSLAQKDEKIRSSTLKVLNKEVNGNVMWSSFSGDQQIKDILATLDSINNPEKDAFEFSLSVAAKGGVSGNNLQLAIDAKKIAFKLAENTSYYNKKAWLKDSTSMYFIDQTIKQDFEVKYNEIIAIEPNIIAPPTEIMEQQDVNH